MSIKQRVRTYIFTALSAAVALTGLLGSQSFAVTNSTDNVLKISPLRTDISIAAGTSKSVPITITNPSDSAIEISPVENDFIASGEDGTPAIILDANTYAPTHSLKRFMTPVAGVTITEKQSVTINVLITVPKTAQAGGYFGAIRFAPTTPGSGGQVNLSANVASLILLTVPGPTVEKLTMTDFDIQQSGNTGTFFRTPNNIQAYIRFENEGNLQESPFGVVSVKNGDKVVYDSNFNTEQPRDEILPDSARRWDVPLKDIGTFGHYTVTATLAYGLNNQTIEVSQSFWIVPMWAIIVAIVAVVVLIGIIILIVFAIRRARRRRGHARYRR